MPFRIYHNKRVFISGHTGFKGSWLSLWLNTLKAKIYGYALVPETSPNHFALLSGEKELFVKSHFADINDAKTLENALCECEPDIIFHLAAQPLVRRSYKNPYETFNTNIIGTLNILNAARKLKNLKAIVIITTDKVYENKEWIWGYRENDTLGGYDPYSASKACAEIVADSMRNSFFNLKDFGIKHQVLIATARAGNVIGGGDWSENRLIPDLMRAYQDQTKAIIRNPNATRPWQHVLEPLRGYLALGERLLKAEREFATSFNFGPNIEGNLSVGKMLEFAKSCWGKIEYEIKHDCNAVHEANLLMLDSTKARVMLGIKPLLSVEQSIEKTLEWYKAFYEDSRIFTQQHIADYINIISMGGGGVNNPIFLIFITCSPLFLVFLFLHFYLYFLLLLSFYIQIYNVIDFSSTYSTNHFLGEIS